MRALLWLVGLFALAVILVVAGRYNNGYVLLSLAPYRVQISLNLVVLLALAAFTALYFTVRLSARALALPGSVASYRARRRQERATQALQEAARLFFEGRYGHACRQAELAYEAGVAPGLAALTAARATHMLREPERSRRWLGLASEHDRHIRNARLMIEAEMAIAERRFDDAASRLEALRSLGQRHIAALRLALQTEQARGRWDEVARLARQLAKHHALTADQARPLIRRALIEQLREREGDLDALRQFWASVPTEERTDTRFLVRALPYLIGAGDSDIAPQAIEVALGREWDSELAVLFGRSKGGEVRRRLATAEAWLVAQPQDAGLLLTLGRLCLEAQLWGKAESYLEASLSCSPSRAAHLELARLAESLGREKQAQHHFRAAAELGT